MRQRIILIWTKDLGLWPNDRMAAALRRLPGHMDREVRRRGRPEDRQACVLGRLLVRLALDTLGVEGNLADWTADRFGRPFLPGRPADFSLSHSGGLVAAAACLGGRVGVDVEIVSPLSLDALDTAFTPGERDDILAAEDQQRRALELWTAKEAALKADGRGLSLDPGRIDARERAIQLGGTAYSVTRCDLLPDGVCSVATTRPDAVVDVIRVDAASGVFFPRRTMRRSLPTQEDGQ